MADSTMTAGNLAREAFNKFSAECNGCGLDQNEWIEAIEELQALAEGALDAARDEMEDED